MSRGGDASCRKCEKMRGTLAAWKLQAADVAKMSEAAFAAEHRRRMDAMYELGRARAGRSSAESRLTHREHDFECLLVFWILTVLVLGAPWFLLIPMSG